VKAQIERFGLFCFIWLAGAVQERPATAGQDVGLRLFESKTRRGVPTKWLLWRNPSLPTFKDAIYSVFFVLYRLAQLVPERPATAGQEVGLRLFDSKTRRGVSRRDSFGGIPHCPQKRRYLSVFIVYFLSFLCLLNDFWVYL